MHDLYNVQGNHGLETLTEAREYANQEGSFTLLDVRQPSEYESARIPGSLLMPLPSLSEQLQELDPDKPVIAY